MTKPSTPTSDGIGFDDDERRRPHTHPVPRALKLALVAFSVALLMSGCAVLYVLAQTAASAQQVRGLVQQQAQTAYDTCVSNRDTSRSNADFYGALLGRLGAGSDPVVREQIARQAGTALKNSTRDCGPNPAKGTP